MKKLVDADISSRNIFAVVGLYKEVFFGDSGVRRHYNIQLIKSFIERKWNRMAINLFVEQTKDFKRPSVMNGPETKSIVEKLSLVSC